MTSSVYAAMSAVQKDLAATGIAKAQTNAFDKYQFRGIDDVYNALGPILAKHGLVIFPRVTGRELVERTSQKGGAMLHAILDVEYTFAGPDGSSVSVSVVGEAIDRGDKSINKALSAAYKLAVFQTFCIPVDAQDPAADSPSIGSGASDGLKATISAKTIKAIESGLAAAQMDAARLCEAYGVAAIADLDDEQAASALKRLAERAKKLTTKAVAA